MRMREMRRKRPEKNQVAASPSKLLLTPQLPPPGDQAERKINISASGI